MCGILLCRDPGRQFNDEHVEFAEAQPIEIPGGLDAQARWIASTLPCIAARGPNFASWRGSAEYSTAWFSSVLSLRQPFTKQSLVVDGRYVLQFNGELYNDEIEFNDTQYIADMLARGEASIPDIIARLDGEFAYTIYDTEDQKYYFGRDAIGKRSLSYYVNTSKDQLYVSSVTGRVEDIEFRDCIAGIIYIYDAKNQHLDDSNHISDPYTVSPLVDENFTERGEHIEKLHFQLNLAVEKRINSIHPNHIENSPISVLFSGGLDCSVIVALICNQLSGKARKTVELLNVGFENPRTGLVPSDSPDRKLAIESYKTLQHLYPDIDIRLIEIDVPYEEYLRAKPKVIDLMFPKQTEMDLSIAIAFYFASKGEGSITDKSTKGKIAYQRKGIVLFSGLGADELYGGYHKFANKSFPDLQIELTRQINNIHDRNLNRDDKVIASNGVEIRYPFLDSSVVKFSTEDLPINYKINKLILRDLAATKLSLGSISQEPKRAIQFGSKSAKMTKDGNKHGTDRLT
ncbi:putative asparagine synthase KNAG_0J00200 [Huiozyma naganishii CBS 8797]|uniref:Asparagine synthase (glutamine-hydrolyzing) n=1 Tax=Huiozyma naganishii (strain ATCC MYA-139 / BCRC 22969 / CBS 8797 / KCTC 17520 / NBRC 10181 / NCYC 3082 / Yp74L-3) TaxID=1071383 RepID=J7RQN2_HUIN7|nr:hypothetical protein KNAG_0J00200 [Kazachstania naganishii CBS 8797]CCK72103.1 hypothetical protein KNAG_0J00200 [Kazachstania naganishii CBS 8797]